MSCSCYCSFLIFLTSLSHLLLLSFSHQQQDSPPFFPRSLLFEEKTRLGSTPPSCYNKCRRCHPCMAVQVPTMPAHHKTRPDSTPKTKMDLLDPSSSEGSNSYSNYKPLGWKCRCGDHIFNP